MNVFFLVEGRHTERKVYPKWLCHLVPSLTQVAKPSFVKANHFCIVSGHGYPSILTYLGNSVEEANRLDCFDFFVIVVDADDKTVSERETEIMNYMMKEGIKLSNKIELIIISQRVCIETWFLGNRKIFKKNVDDPILSKWISFYNVKTDDPEEMLLFPNFSDAIGSFHKVYFKKMMFERNLKYTEQTTNSVEAKTFLDQIIKRYKQGDIVSFGKFLSLCEKLR
jgi:hypothetical protein